MSEQNNVGKHKTKKLGAGVKTILIALILLILMFLTGILSITNEGCTLPIDLVLFGELCVFGSFGATLGATIALTVLMALLAGVGKLLTFFFRKG